MHAYKRMHAAAIKISCKSLYNKPPQQPIEVPLTVVKEAKSSRESQGI